MVNDIMLQDVKELAERPSLDLAKLKGSTILIAGGNSLIGRYLTYLFCYLNEEKGFDITLYVLVRNLKKAEKSFAAWFGKPYFNFLHQDICDPIDIAANEADTRIDYLFHLAGSASARFISEDPTGIIKANTVGTINILELAKNTQAKNVILASTREIYGRLPEATTRITEADMGSLDPSQPRNSYPLSKKIAEALLVAYTQQFDIVHTILRIAHTYGPLMEIENDGRIMADLIGAVVRKENIVLHSDGTAVRGFCYITDCIDGILRAALSDNKQRVFNLANETEPHMVREVAQMLVESFPELGLEVHYSQEEAFKGGYNPIPLVQLDTDRIESIGWMPHISLQEGIRRTVLSFE